MSSPSPVSPAHHPEPDTGHGLVAAEICLFLTLGSEPRKYKHQLYKATHTDSTSSFSARARDSLMSRCLAVPLEEAKKATQAWMCGNTSVDRSCDG